MSGEHKTAYEQAVDNQRLAADPTRSVFVSANAGSGKTRVLVDRVSRILLRGTRPDKILCLTYTKAAAAEMQTRLFETLGEWSILPIGDLNETLNRLENTSGLRKPEELERARSLFARALETPGGLKVQTIHAFCERLLKRFPLEAGITPGFEPMDEAQADELRAQVWDKLLAQAAKAPDSEPAQAILHLAAHKNNDEIDKLLAWALHNIRKIRTWQDKGGPALLEKALEVNPQEQEEDVISRAVDDIPENLLIKIAPLLDGCKKTDQNVAEKCRLVLACEDMEEKFALYADIFLTQAGGERKRLLTQDGFAAIAAYSDAFIREAGRVVGAFETCARLRLYHLACAFFILASEAVALYVRLKRERRLMDFDDQIELARALLLDGEASDWVRYKMDGGIDHILVDEAQDTSRLQWDIIDALSAEFLQKGAGTHIRTNFAVGDEKQSIYGFQGAEPEEFLRKVQSHIASENNAKEVSMRMSFRSCQQVLELVDEIFYGLGGIRQTFDAAMFAPGSDVRPHLDLRQGGHTAYRPDQGLVELWPVAPKAEKTDDTEPWKPVPVDSPDALSSRERLAAAIAGQIKSWLDKGERIGIRTKDEKGNFTTRTRPLRPGDILILVQQRNAFFDALIRNLKAEGVPVAGADRINVKDHIAVQDLLSLAKFCLQPLDDLSLAEVLKSPLIGWSDTELFEIAHGRRGSLWAALPDGETRVVLEALRTLSRHYAPYEFFARTLAFTVGGKSLRGRIYERMGIEAAEVLDVFLARALAHQRRGAPSLQAFIGEMEASDQTVKREMGAGANEVRVMTVHGAKGLEAPLVILPDTLRKPSIGRQAVLETEAGCLPMLSEADRPDWMAEQIEKTLEKYRQESMRLLYVALTRAESRLLICGYASGSGKEIKIPEGSWYEWARRALERLNTETIQTPFGEGLRFGTPSDDPEMATKSAIKADITPLPGWALRPPETQMPVPRFLSPSHLGPKQTQADSQPVFSPLAREEQDRRFGRGLLIHKLLEILPDLPPEHRTRKALSFLHKQGLSAAEAEALAGEVMAVLTDPAFARVFAPGSRAEVNIAGHAKALPASVRLSGQIDRLCVFEDDVWIIDYKSNRPPPERPEDIPAAYLTQMAAYRALLLDIYPGKTIRAALLWTDTPKIMEIPQDRLDAIEWGEIFEG